MISILKHICINLLVQFISNLYTKLIQDKMLPNQ